MTTSHLTEDQLNELILRYYAGEKVADLIAAYDLRVAPNRIPSLFPPFVLEELPCPYCGRPLLQNAPTRTAYQSGHGVAPPFCPACGHQAHERCGCNGCHLKQLEKQREADRINRLIIERLRRRPRHEPIKVDDISFRDAVHLVALARVGLLEDSDEIQALREHSHALRCTQESGLSIVRELYERELVDLSFANAPGQITTDAEGRLDSDWAEVRLQLQLGRDAEESITVLRNMEARLGRRSAWPDHWKHEALPLWYELALDEVLPYLAMRLRDHHYEPRFGEKTIHVFRSLLERHSVYEIFNFIWGGVRDAASYQVRHSVSRRQAANAVLGNCQRRAERAIAEGWIVKHFRRDPKVPQSECTSFYANFVMRLGERFFSQSPSEHHCNLPS